MLDIALTFRVLALRVRVISKLTNYSKTWKKNLVAEYRLTLPLKLGSRQWIQVTKSRGINADIQSPRTKLLYFIYTAPNSRVKAAPGTKSSIGSALGYKSDGHFHYDWNYLISSEMIEEKQGYYLVTDRGRKEFALQSTASRSNSIMILMGIALVFFTILLEFGNLPKVSFALFGIALISIGFLFLIINRRNKPELPLEARDLLKELNRQ